MRLLQVPMDDDELARHLTTVRSQIENVTIDLGRREELALEMAATLDRAAQSSPDPESRRHRWSEAIELLDWFLKENPDPPRERQLRFQAAVFGGPRGEAGPTPACSARTIRSRAQEAAAALDDAIAAVSLGRGWGQ